MGKDEQLFFLDEEEEDVHWFHSSGPSENIFEHGYVSAKVIKLFKTPQGTSAKFYL